MTKEIITAIDTWCPESDIATHTRASDHDHMGSTPNESHFRSSISNQIPSDLSYGKTRIYDAIMDTVNRMIEQHAAPIAVFSV